MGALYSVMVFLAGIFLGVRTLAALLGVIDLWYTIRSVWPTVLLRILIWTGLTVGLLLLIDEGRRWWLVAGLAFHILVWVLVNLFLVRAGAQTPKPTPVVE